MERQLMQTVYAAATVAAVDGKRQHISECNESCFDEEMSALVARNGHGAMG
jgi:hypothetical protein